MGEPKTKVEYFPGKYLSGPHSAGRLLDPYLNEILESEKSVVRPFVVKGRHCIVEIGEGDSKRSALYHELELKGGFIVRSGYYEVNDYETGSYNAQAMALAISDAVRQARVLVDFELHLTRGVYGVFTNGIAKP